MTYVNEQALAIQNLTGLKPVHFADLIRTAQLIFDPSSGVIGRKRDIEWQDYDIPKAVADNLKVLGFKYQYSTPHLPIEVVWEQLKPETRSWFIENRNTLWKFEEIFPPFEID